MENQYIIFKIGEETYGIRIEYVAEIIRMQAITKMPKTLDFVQGIINLRGRVIPIVDLKQQFDLGKTDCNNDTRIIVTEIKDQTVGLMVEEVSEVLSLSEENIEPPSNMATVIKQKFIQGVGKRDKKLLILLDVEQIFEDQTIKQLGEIQDEVSAKIIANV